MINSNGSTDRSTDQTDQPINQINQINQINNGVEIMDKTIFTAEAGGVSLQGRLEGMDHLRKPYEGTLAVLFPGRSYPSTAPLLYYSDRLFWNTKSRSLNWTMAICPGTRIPGNG